MTVGNTHRTVGSTHKTVGYTHDNTQLPKPSRTIATISPIYMN